jgi:hypothetical protein
MNGSLIFDRNDSMDDLSEYKCIQEFHFMKNHTINNTMLVDLTVFPQNKCLFYF